MYKGKIKKSRQTSLRDAQHRVVALPDGLSCIHFPLLYFYREIPKDSRSSSHYFCRVGVVTITICLVLEFVRSPLASGTAWVRGVVV